MISNLSNSRIRGKDLNILVIPPTELRKTYQLSYINSKMQDYFIAGIDKSNKMYRWDIKGTKLTNTKAVQAFYYAMKNSKDRVSFIDKLIKKTKYNQVLFSNYKTGLNNKLKIRVYIYDKDDLTMGKEPLREYKSIVWNDNNKVGTAEDVSRMVRDLIGRYFTS